MRNRDPLKVESVPEVSGGTHHSYALHPSPPSQFTRDSADALMAMRQSHKHLSVLPWDLLEISRPVLWSRDTEQSGELLENDQMSTKLLLCVREQLTARRQSNTTVWHTNTLPQMSCISHLQTAEASHTHTPVAHANTRFSLWVNRTDNVQFQVWVVVSSKELMRDLLISARKEMGGGLVVSILGHGPLHMNLWNKQSYC